MTWFKRLTGIDETSAKQVRSELRIEGDHFVFPSGKRCAFGRLETPTLAELRAKVDALKPTTGRLTLREVVDNVQSLHADPINANALFQVASQFNLLEMSRPATTPERGVGIYEHDHTQGPACAIAGGAGTIYRNYYAPVGNRIGQSADHQIDCSSDLGILLGNDNGKLWTMQNGYLFPTDTGLKSISQTLASADETERDRYRQSLRIGLQCRTAVTLPGASHRVSQAYCSALPVAYGRQPPSEWTEFAKLVLEAAYESTLCAAILNEVETGSNKLYLTLLGGGVFGNKDTWITDAIRRSIERYQKHDIDVAIVSYGSFKPVVQQLVKSFRDSKRG